MNREEFEKSLRDAGFKFDGHVTQGSFQAQLTVIDEYMKAPRCPRCGSYKLSCCDGHTWEIGAS